MKTPTDLIADIERRLERTWHTDLTGDTTSWPHTFPLGTFTKAELETRFTTVQQQAREWRDWARTHNVDLTITTRRVHSTLQDIPTHAAIPSLARAVDIAKKGWAHRTIRAAERRTAIRDRFPDTPHLARLLRGTESYTDTDFDLLLTIADWITHNDATGYTPRQVPIPGVHAKWLNTHQPHILALTGRDTLGLLPDHPARIHFTYLDRHHRAGGGRWHDSATVGDQYAPCYQPQVVVISENKDTAIHFPTIPGGISVEGGGFGGKTAAAFAWLTGAPHLYYWGDIDAHGYEILNGWRADGVPVTSILMDLATYDQYEPYGTNSGKKEQSLTAGNRKPLPHLTDDERAVYERITDPDWTGHRRIEQERVPLAQAHGLVCRASGDYSVPMTNTTVGATAYGHDSSSRQGEQA
jgi:hypothetical protein